MDVKASPEVRSFPSLSSGTSQGGALQCTWPTYLKSKIGFEIL